MLVQVFHHPVEGVLAAVLGRCGDIGMDAGRDLFLGHTAVSVRIYVFQYYLAGPFEPLALLPVPAFDTDVDDAICECYNVVHGVFVVGNTNLTISMCRSTWMLGEVFNRSGEMAFCVSVTQKKILKIFGSFGIPWEMRCYCIILDVLLSLI